MDERNQVLGLDEILAMIGMNSGKQWKLITNPITNLFELTIPGEDGEKLYFGPDWRQMPDEEFEEFCAKMDRIAQFTTKVADTETA
jgi:hypothetical protein